jgi:GNAT superfamily N-acetyltransferase
MNPLLPPPSVRTARPDDAPELAFLLTELGYPAPAGEVAARLAAMRSAGETVLVAVRGNSPPLGLVSVHVTPVLHRPTPVGRLTALVVRETARGQGVGRALVAAAEQLLAARGCALVEITSNHRLTQAHAFYEHLGYQPTSRRFKKVIDLQSPQAAG